MFSGNNLNQDCLKSSCKVNSVILLALVNVFQEKPGFEIGSNRSSYVFERSHTHRNKEQEVKAANNEEHIRITTLRDLLRLFRVNLKANDTFEYSGQRYFVELEDNFSSTQSPRVSRNNVYGLKETKRMPHVESAESHFSPIDFNSDSKKDDSEQEDLTAKLEDVMVASMRETESKQQPMMVNQEIQIDLNELESYQKGILNEKVEDKIEPDSFYADIASKLALEIELEMEEEEKRENDEKERQKQQQLEYERQLIQQQDQQTVGQNQNNFYDDISRQLALEIEMEEQREQELEEKLKAKKEAKEFQADNKPSTDDFYAEIQRKLALEIEEFGEDMFDPVPDKSQNKKAKNESQQSPEYRGHHLGASVDATVQKKSANIESFNIRDSLAMTVNQAAKDSKFARSISVVDYKELIQKKAVAAEKQQLLHELSQAKLELESLNSMFQSKGYDASVADAQLHMAFLFASPLVIRNGNSSRKKDEYDIIPLLEFGKEFQEIKASIKETGKLVKIRHQQATIENLTKILIQNPKALHFSGHGEENKKNKQGSSDGNYLLFEADDGECEIVTEKMLQEFIQSSNVNLEFVFVASCYSEFAGKIFLNAGAKHVVCVKSGFQIADLAVITFSKSFYNSVFSQKTICDSFRIAQMQVQVKYGPAEANKFSILIRNEGSPVTNSSLKSKLSPSFGGSQHSFSQQSSNDPNHKCKILGPLKDGEAQFLEPKPRFKEYPCKVDNLIGRQKEMFEVVHNTLKHRFVTIIGLPGIGKTALTKNAVHYMADRRLFKQGIIFLQLKGFMSLELFMKKLIVNFVRQNFDLEEEDKKQVENTEHLLGLALKYLKSQEENLLIVFDNVEDLLYYDKQCFSQLINEILINVPNLHILMTSRTILGALQDISEKILVLNELTPFFTVELFLSRSREIPKEEIQDLLTCQPENYILVGDQDGVNKNKKITKLTEHHFFKILGGNPHAIILAAPLLIKMPMRELYLLINSKEMHDVLQVDGIKDSTVASLRLSLEASIKIIQKEDEECLQFFFLIGMLPGGIEEEELSEIWGPGYAKHSEKLLNFSLVQRKESQNEKMKLILPPFMSNYAEAKIAQEDKLVFQNYICGYYSKICKQILDKNGKSLKSKNGQADLSHEFMAKLVKHETNIWACIYRLVDAPIPKIETISNNPVLTKEATIKMRRISTIINPDRSFESLMKSQTFVEINSMRPTAASNKKQLSFVPQKNLIIDQQDTSDSRPFEINLSQTPRQEDSKTFDFQDEADQKVSQSMLKNQQSILSKINEEDDCKSGDNDSIHTDSQDESDDNDEDDNSPTREPAFLLGLPNSEQKQVNEIIRNSYVNFSRPSVVGSQILSLIKSPDIQKIALQKRMTITSKQQNMMLPQLQTNKSYSSSKQLIKVEELHDAEKMIIYYVMNLFLLRENDSALQLINDYALKAHGSILYEANLYRVLGLVYYHKSEITKSLDAFKTAYKLYSQLSSKYGQALCKYSAGFISRNKIHQVTDKLDEDSILKKSKGSIEGAMSMFKEINHIVGIGLCHQQLALIEPKLQIKSLINHPKESLKYMKMFTNYTDKASCPHVKRIHGNEISLMSEIVHENENKNLFSSATQTQKSMKQPSNTSQLSNSEKILSSKQMDSLKHHTSTQFTDSQLQLNLQDSLESPTSSPMKRENSSQSIDELDSFEITISQNKLSDTTTNPPLQKQPTNQYKRIKSTLEVVNEEEEAKDDASQKKPSSKTRIVMHSHKQSQQVQGNKNLQSVVERKKSFEKSPAPKDLINAEKEAQMNSSAKKIPAKPKQIKTTLMKK